MKRIYLFIVLIAFITAFSLSGCTSDSDSEYIYTLVYEIYWGGNYVERKTITSNECIIMGSCRGTNRIYTVEKGYVEDTSAPIRKVSYTKSKKK